MDMLLTAVVALALLSAAGYVHFTLPRYTKSPAQIWITRALLLVAGIAFGMIGAMKLYGYPAQWLVFLAGFGLVHLPAAVILFVKSRRGAGKS